MGVPPLFERGSILREVFAYFEQWRQPVDSQMDKFFHDELMENPFCQKEYGRSVLERIAELTLRGGKRQRVAFVVGATSLFNENVDAENTKQAIIDSAMGVEILQTHLLIHDDIVDEAPTRRSGSTIHRFFKEQFLERRYPKGDAKKFGDAVALFAGDLAVYFACQPILKSTAIPAEKKIKILQILIRSGIDTFYGQVLDVLRDVRGTTSEDEILELAFVKAGRSSAEAPMYIGAVLAGHDDEETLRKLTSYAVPASIAAQLQDDILGMFGTDEVIGKSSLSDLSEGKQTLLILEAKKRANSKNLATLESLVGKKDITREEAEQVKKIVVETGALQYVKDVARKFAEQAKTAIGTWGENWNPKAKRFFLAVAEAAITRDY